MAGHEGLIADEQLEMHHLGVRLLAPDIMPCKVPVRALRPDDGPGIFIAEVESAAAEVGVEGRRNHLNHVGVVLHNINVGDGRNREESPHDTAESQPRDEDPPRRDPEDREMLA